MQLRNEEEAMRRLKATDFEKRCANTGIGTDGFHPTVPLDLADGSCGVFLRKGGHGWDVADKREYNFFLCLSQKNVTSERPIAPLPTPIKGVAGSGLRIWKMVQRSKPFCGMRVRNMSEK